MTSDGENDDSNDDASILSRDDDASCLAAMPTTASHSDDLLKQRDNRGRWGGNRLSMSSMDNKRQLEQTERQKISGTEGVEAGQSGETSISTLVKSDQSIAAECTV